MAKKKTKNDGKRRANDNSSPLSAKTPNADGTLIDVKNTPKSREDYLGK